MIEANFKFYPVGQGCFYAGSIKTKTDQFVIVYDCGSVSKENYLNDSIDEFRTRFKKIDLLMISHFDKDHVNGVNRLLMGINCKLVVIPYYLPIIRLALFGNSDPDNDYTSFIKDPINYFLDTNKFDVDEVLVLENGNDNEENPKKAPEPKNPEKQLELIEKIILDKIKDNDDDFKSRVNNNEENEPNSKDKVKYLTLPFKISLSNEFWEFVFYLKNFNDPIGLNDFREDIDKILTKTKDGKLTSLFDELYTLKIKELYKKHFVSDINYTSLVAYHGPLKHNKFTEIYLSYFSHWWPHFEPMKKTGILLTGDSFLKKDEDFNPFYNYYSPYYIENSFLFQIPHHGSKKNWKDLPNGLEEIPFYIINHGWGRKKHPNKDVVANIVANKHKNLLISNNESSAIQYAIIITR
jgi:hypothetical protein